MPTEAEPPAEFLFRGRFRIDSARLRGYDYRSAGLYHVVMCTAHRLPWFGCIADGTVGLSTAGVIVRDELLRTPDVRADVDIDTCVVMPDHVHAILVLGGAEATEPTDAAMPAGSLGAIVNQIKGACTKRIRATGLGEFAWQPRFYDRIIRSRRELQATRLYIEHNPWRWDEAA